ncbi:DUF4127 family protein [Deinococcus yavapaiensis]|uniref:Uncharacterized protein DUF4127 n=1 Tax=Deinococcus yavapaiensis KR-236 TaxID=694435 RepID=A0A318SR39_9DEIO|nr:DUF4127 family protein [Deinococcus yavapaiensis]PYE55393.1 uncharacterized protein DUF4127 [Deinococcus yavapaiensis KR-236]
MHILLLPCDSRPPTLDLPHQLAEAAGVSLLSPPKNLLNDCARPADTRTLHAWLLEHAPSADVLVVSLEMLTLGGLVPARRESTPLTDVLERLATLRELKASHPSLRILAHGIVVRVAHDDDPLEEKPYYGEWGARLRAVSEWTDRNERANFSAETSARLQEARNAVPTHVLTDWLATRERNHAMHEAAIDLLHEGVLERLHLTLDDTTPYGLAARDRRELEAKLDALDLWDKAEVYPGADEVSSVLLARALLGERRLKVKVVYPSPLSVAATTLYEDRPLGPLVHDHLKACGCEEVTSGEAFTLFVSAPAVRQGHAQPDFESVDTPARNLPAFASKLREALSRGEKVVLADVAYPNGAERRLMTLLGSAPLANLTGYAAWNTAGNTLGGAIATGVCVLHGQGRERARVEALFSRLVDDWLYQADVRAEVWNVLPAPNIFDLGDQMPLATTEVDARLAVRARELWQTAFAPRFANFAFEWHGASLAWPRLFTGVFPLTVRDA